MNKRFFDQKIISTFREAEAWVSAHKLFSKHVISYVTFDT